MPPPLRLNDAMASVLREGWGRALSALTASLGDLQLAEDALQDAVVEALKRWPEDGLPRVPAAWLVTTARRRAIDRWRRARNFASKAKENAYLSSLPEPEAEAGEIPDQRLEMMFTCCHPALAEKTRIALTLRTLGGLSTDAIAAAFVDKPETIAQRLVRAKRKIAKAGIPYRIPASEELPERLATVLRVIYLIFNEGYATRKGPELTRVDLSDEAIRLARILRSLLPDETEVAGLLALMLLHDSRRLARLSKDGRMIALQDQDRARWDRIKISEGDALLRATLSKKRVGPYQLQAAISAVHVMSPTWERTDWPQIAGLYAALYELESTAVVRINQAIAVGYAHGAEHGLSMLTDVGRHGALVAYQPYHAARAELLLRCGDLEAAQGALERAIELADNQREKEFLVAKVASVEAASRRKSSAADEG